MNTIKITMNMMFIIRVESNVKLNLYTNEGVPLIKPEDRLEPEVHFMQLEAVQTRYTVALPTIIMELWR